MSKLDDFVVAEGYPDVRDWKVLGNDGIKIGEVDELIVDVKAQKVRYLDINIYEKLFENDDYDEHCHILVPIGAAILNRDDKNVIIPQLGMDRLRQYPVYRKEPVYVLPDYERSVRDFYRGQSNYNPHYDPAFYDDPYYNDEKFLAL